MNIGPWAYLWEAPCTPLGLCAMHLLGVCAVQIPGPLALFRPYSPGFLLNRHVPPGTRHPARRTRAAGLACSRDGVWHRHPSPLRNDRHGSARHPVSSLLGTKPRAFAQQGVKCSSTRKHGRYAEMTQAMGYVTPGTPRPPVAYVRLLLALRLPGPPLAAEASGTHTFRER